MPVIRFPLPADGRLGLNVAEVAALLGVSYPTVVQAIERGQIPAARLGRRRVIPRSWVEAFSRGEIGPLAITETVE